MSGERPGLSTFPRSADPEDLFRAQHAMAVQLPRMHEDIRTSRHDLGKLEGRVDSLEKTDRNFHAELTELKVGLGGLQTALKVWLSAVALLLAVLQVALTFWPG